MKNEQKYLNTLTPKRDRIIRTAFGTLDDVIVNHNGVDYYGWVTQIHIYDGLDLPDGSQEGGETYDVTLIESWEGEPFKSEHKTFIYLEDVDPEREDHNMRKSDRKERV